MSGRPTSSRAPALLVALELEQLPRVEIHADTAEAEARIVAWATRPATFLRLRDALADALDELREAA